VAPWTEFDAGLDSAIGQKKEPKRIDLCQLCLRGLESSLVWQSLVLTQRNVGACGSAIVFANLHASAGVAIMSFKTVLTVTGPSMSDGDLKLAAGLCEEVGAHLAVLVLMLAAPPPAGEFAPLVSDDWLKEDQAGMKLLENTTAALSTLLAGRTLSTDITCDYPDAARADETIGRRARYADATVVGPALLAGETLKTKVIEGVLFFSGKPLLLIPEGSRPTLKPKRVLVAWDQGLEASRAVRESIDLLAAADNVHLALVDPVVGETHHGAEPGADAAAYLARHGVKVTVDRLPSASRSVADVLRQHSVDIAADLMVMGAYGHSRLREHIFGGVTSSMLASPSLPTLLAR
jgi:nucleotide-binding universal stress UspA family protein